MPESSYAGGRPEGARHGTTGLLDCHIGYTFKYVTVPDRNDGQFAACFRGCGPFLADVQRAEDARRSEQIPMVLGAVQAVEEKVVAKVAAEASGLDLDASSVAVGRTDKIVRELVRPGVICRDTAAPKIHTIVGNMDDARALFDTPQRWWNGGHSGRLSGGWYPRPLPRRNPDQLPSQCRSWNLAGRGDHDSWSLSQADQNPFHGSLRWQQ